MTEILKAKTPEHAREILQSEDKQRSGRYKNGRCFNLRCYLTDTQLQRVFTQHRSKIRCYGYCQHNKDTDENGELLKAHYHIVLRTYSQFTRFQIFRWFEPFLFEYREGEWHKLESLHIELTRDISASVAYLTHANEPDKHHYDIDEIVTDDIDDLSHVQDRAKDDSFDIIEDIVNGMTERELLKKYGREYIYHKKQYRDCAVSMMYEENAFMNDAELRWQEVISAEAYARLVHERRKYLSGDNYWEK